MFLINKRKREVKRYQNGIILKNDKFLELYRAGKRILANFNKTADWLTVKFDEQFKLFYNQQTDDCALMKPRQRSMGIRINHYFYSTDECIFYKELN